MKISNGIFGILMFILAGFTVTTIGASYILWSNWSDMVPAYISPVTYYTYNLDEWYVRHGLILVVVILGVIYFKGGELLMGMRNN